LLLIPAGVQDAFAIPIESNGSGGGDWDDGSTWAGGVVPSSTDDVTIKNGDVVTIKDTRTIDVGGSLTIEVGAELIIDGLSSGDLTNFGEMTNNGLISINGGTGTSAGRLTNRIGGSLTNNATIEINGGIGFISGQLISQGVFTNNNLVTVNGATSPGSGIFLLNNALGSFTNAGTIIFNGGAGDNSGNFQIFTSSNITNECTGTITMNGDGLRSGRIISSGTIVNSGLIILNGGDGAISGGLIGGTIINHNTITENPGIGVNSGIISGGGTMLIEDPIPCPEEIVGGKTLLIDSTALLLAGAQSFSWMIPVVLSGIGIGLFVVSRKSE